MARVAYIIPGFRHDVLSEDYRRVAGLFERKGIIAVATPVMWKRKALTDWVTEVRAQFRHQGEDQVFLFGFSYGAMIALMVASDINPAGLLLASLSPYFMEDLATVPASWKRTIGTRRIKDFERCWFMDQARKVDCPTWLFVGEEEARKFPQLEHRAQEAYRLISGSRLIRVPGAGHDLGQASYQQAIEAVVNRF